jgi:hypothetical protein
VAELDVAVVNNDTMVTPSTPKINITTTRYTRILPFNDATVRPAVSNMADIVFGFF